MALERRRERARRLGRQIEKDACYSTLRVTEDTCHTLVMAHAWPAWYIKLSPMADQIPRVTRETRGKGSESVFPVSWEIQVLEPNFIGSARCLGILYLSEKPVLLLGILYLSEKPVLLASPAGAALGTAERATHDRLRHTERTNGRGVVRCEETGNVGFPDPCTLCHYSIVSTSCIRARAFGSGKSGERAL